MKRAGIWLPGAEQGANLLRQAERHIRVLKSVSWRSEVGQKFLASGGTHLPVVSYPVVETGEARALIRQARTHVGSDQPVFDWLVRVADVLALACDLLDARGTPEFYQVSKQIYGTPENTMLDGKTRSIDLARHLDSVLSELSFDQLVLGGQAEGFGAVEFAEKLSDKLDRYFDGHSPKVEIVPHLSAKALAGAKRIRVRADAAFGPMDVRQLLYHEALVHTATAMNGRAQTKFPILASAHPGTTEVQEGLAVFAEIITGAMDPKRFRRLVDRVIAIQMSVEGADFIEVFRYFVRQNGDEGQAFEDTRRVFRGGVLTGGAPFTKDGVYLNGLLRVHNFMRTVTKLGRADLLRLLFVGKLDIEDIPALALLASQGLIKPPKILPPWMKDMRFLVSYLAYSSFLNRVKLPGFQRYYRDKLEDVPEIWGFNQSPATSG